MTTISVELELIYTERRRDRLGFESLTPPQKVLLLIASTHGLVGNGGFEYLFEQKVDIEGIAAAYEAIKLPEAAQIMRQVAQEFPPNSVDHDARLQHVKNNKSKFMDFSRKMWKLADATDDQLCAYVGVHATDFTKYE